MPQILLRPSSAKSRAPLPSPYSGYSGWSGETVTNVNDNSDSTYAYLDLNATRCSYWNITDASLASNTIINSVTVYARDRYTASDVFYFAPESTVRAYDIAAIWNDSFYDYNWFLNGPKVKDVLKDTWSTRTLGTFTTKPDGTPFTLAEANAIALMLQSYGNTPNSSSYQLQVSDVWLVIDYNQPSAPTGASPNATVFVAQPNLGFTHVDADGEAATAYRVRVIPVSKLPGDANWNAFNDADPTKFLWDSGVVSASIPTGGAFTVPLDTPADNNTTYRAYIQTLAGGIWSQPVLTGPYAWFATKFKQPSVPQLETEADDENNRILLRLDQGENQASDDQAQQNTTIADWTAKSNSTLARVTGITRPDGSVGAILDARASASGDYEFGVNDSSAPPWVVVPGRVYSAVLKGIPAGTLASGTPNTETARRFRIDIKWFTSANSLISTSIGKEYHTVINEWVMAEVTATAPATAAKAAIRIRVLGSTGSGTAEQHYFSEAGFWMGPVNMSGNPLLAIDTNGDGIPDGMALYRWLSSGTAPVWSWEQDDYEHIFAGQGVRKLVMPVGNNDGWVGLYETYRLAKGQQYEISMWCWSDSEVDVDFYTPNADDVNSTMTRKRVHANVLTKVSHHFTQSATLSAETIYYRFAAIGSTTMPRVVADTVWIGAVMVEPRAVDGTDVLTGTSSTFEGSIGNWTSMGDSMTPSYQTTAPLVGTGHMRLRSGTVITGDIEVEERASGTFPGFLGRAVVAGTDYWIRAWVKAATVARTVSLNVRWWDSSGNAVGGDLHNQEIMSGVDNTSAYRCYEGKVTAPTGAAYGQIWIGILGTATGEDHYVDYVTFRTKETTGVKKFEHYTYGGYFNSRVLQVQRLLPSDRTLDGWGWVDFFDRVPDGTYWSWEFVDAEKSDYFVSAEEDVWYRVRIVAPDAQGNSTVSDWSEVVRGAELAALTETWLKSSNNPDLNRTIRLLQNKLEMTVQKQQVSHMPLGRTKPIVVSGRRRSVSFPFRIWCPDEETQLAIEELFDLNESLLLQSPKRNVWVSVAGDYEVAEYTRDNDVDTLDTVISGTFQEVATP